MSFLRGRQTLSVEDVAFSNSELLKSTSLCITPRHRQSPSLGKLGADEFIPVVLKEIQGIVHEAVPDHQPILSPISEIQIGIGKSDNRMVFLDGLSLQASMERQTMSMTEISLLKMSSLYKTLILPL